MPEHNTLRAIRRWLLRKPFKGRHRVAEALRRAVGAFGPVVPVSDSYAGLVPGKVWFNCHLGEHIGGHIFWHGGYSTDQLWTLPLLLPEDGVFIDVGANQGEFTLLAAALMPKGQVIAFEPNPVNLLRLQRNLDLNRVADSSRARAARVSVLPVALGAAPGLAPMFTDPRRVRRLGDQNSGVYSLAQSAQRREPVGVVQVDALDSILRMRSVAKVDLIKIDVEGYELEVLAGAVSALRAFRPALLLELNQEALAGARRSVVELLDWLAGQSYTGYLLSPGAYRGLTEAPSFGNALFLPVRNERQARWLRQSADYAQVV